MEQEFEGTFEGYLWYSDQQTPILYTGEKPLTKLELNNEENPFIIEGQLIGNVEDKEPDKTIKKSISIKYVDGTYKVKVYDVERDLKSGIAISRHFKGNKQLKGQNLLFYEVWEATPDENCCNMNVFEAKKMIFGGFENKLLTENK